MIDPLTLTTAISAASAAYGQVKKLVQAGREFEEISESLGKWMGAVSDIDNINKNSNNPSTFDRLFNGSIEEVALKSYSAKLQIQKQKNGDELREATIHVDDLFIQATAKIQRMYIGLHAGGT